MNISTLLEQGLMPDIIDKTDPNDIFMGYYKYNSANYPNICAIRRATTVNGITSITYPLGRFDHVFDFDQRATYKYRFKDFPNN